MKELHELSFKLIKDILEYNKYNLKHPLSKLPIKNILQGCKKSYAYHILDNKDYYNNKLKQEKINNLKIIKDIIEYNKFGKIHPMGKKIYIDSLIDIMNENYHLDNFNLIQNLIELEKNDIDDVNYFLDVTKILFIGNILREGNYKDDYIFTPQDYINYCELLEKNINKIKNGDYL
jgi:hypothetical protein